MQISSAVGPHAVLSAAPVCLQRLGSQNRGELMEVVQDR